MVYVDFINVGQGNMVVITFGDNTTMVYDCNIHTGNKVNILNRLKKIMPKKSINVFVNSHRDADHMRGIKVLNHYYPISTLWDSGVPGNTSTPEYREYMDLRRNIKHKSELRPGQTWKNSSVKILNGKRDKGDANSQSIVLHVGIRDGSSVLLTGDTDAKAWRDFIFQESSSKIKSDILLGSHHGSITFFDDPRDRNYYTSHIKKISPAMTIISVGKNPHGHPNKKALELYKKYSSGSSKGNKVLRTDKNGNMRLTLKDGGGWAISKNQ